MASNKRLKAAVIATTAFYPVTSSDEVSSAAVGKRKRKNRTSKQVSLEMIKNISGDDFTTPQQLAASGNLEDLKALIEVYKVTMKERCENYATLLHHAASNNQVAVMQYLIESGIDLNAIDKNGNTALHVATIQGHVDALHVLLKNRANDTILNTDQDAALHIAMRNNDVQVIATILEYPIEIVIFGHRKRTPLHVIAEHDNIEAAEVFHNSILARDTFRNKGGFRLCAADEDELTPIHLAARLGSHRVLDFMMCKCKSHGYTTEAVLGFLDEENSTPLHAAIDGGHTKVVEVLLKHGAQPNTIKEGQLPPFLLASSQGKLEMMQLMVKYSNVEIIFFRDQFGQTALHRCTQAINSHLIIAYLVQNGAQIDVVDDKGQTPLVSAIISGALCAVSQLVKNGANPLIKDNQGYNALHHAVSRNRKAIMKKLLELPCAQQLVTDGDKKGDSPIHHALSQGKSAMVVPMIATIQTNLKNIKNSSGNNYLHLAAASGDWKALSTLLDIPECHKLLNETNNYGGTPLHLAAGQGHVRAVEILLSQGAMIHRCYVGHTPFLFACSTGHVEAARLTFEAHPFQLAWTDDKGNTALHLAARSGNAQMVTLALDINTPVTHNYNQESFFDIIIEKQDTKCALAVVKHSRWQECLDLVSPFHSHPMISLITSMPDVAKMVLDRSQKTSEHTKEHTKYWMKFNFKYLQLQQPSEFIRGYDEDTDGKHQEELGESTTIHPANTIMYKGSLRKEVPKGVGKPKKLSHLEALRTMVKYNRVSLLIHPVTEHFLKAKWRRYGRWIHLVGTSLVVFQIIFMCIFTFLAPIPSSQVMDDTLCNNSSVSSGSGEMNSTMEFSVAANVFRFITLAFVGVNLLYWLLVVLKLRLDALNFVQNTFVFVDGLSVIFTAIYLIPWPNCRGKLNNAVWEAGAVASFFTLFSLVLRLQLFDLFGVYVTMFLAISRRAFQVLLVCFWFIFAFSLSFYILTGNLKPFSNFGYSLFINFAHLLGEINYESFVEAAVADNLQFSTLTFLFVVTVAIVMGIIIMNLLIGLAVGDIENIRLNAIAEKRAIEIGVFIRLDCSIPKKFLARLVPPYYMKYPNKNVSKMRLIWRYFWRSVKGEDPSHEGHEDTNTITGNERESAEIAAIKDKLEELVLSHEKMREMIVAMHAMQELLVKKVQAHDDDGDEH